MLLEPEVFVSVRFIVANKLSNRPPVLAEATVPDALAEGAPSPLNKAVAGAWLGASFESSGEAIAWVHIEKQMHKKAPIVRQ
jgi:hypothetical protein